MISSTLAPPFEPKTKTATGALALQRMPRVADGSANDSQRRPDRSPWHLPPRTRAGWQTYDERIYAIVTPSLHDFGTVVNPNYHFVAVVSGGFKLHSGMIWGTCGVTQASHETISTNDHQVARASANCTSSGMAGCG
jgi:hypothetical protein